MIPARLKEALYDNLPLSTKLLLKELTFRISGSRSDPTDRPCVVVFDEQIPRPDRDAGSLRMMRILSKLAERWEIIFVPFTNKGDQETTLKDAGIKVANVGEYRRLLKRPRVVAVIVSRPTMAKLFTPRIRKLSPQARIIFDTVDVHFVRLQRECDLYGDPTICADAARHRAIETRLAREVDAVWCASIEDERLLRNEVGDCESVVVPTLHELHDPGPGFDEREGLLFVGSFAHRPNGDAVKYFLAEIYPTIRQDLPEVTFTAVGANPPDDVSSQVSGNVRVPGFVPDLEPYLRGVRVFVAPLRYGGAGTKGKVGEALSHGIPVVSTSVGAEGFGVTSGEDMMIADDPKVFADAVRKVYTDRHLWQKLSANGRSRIEQDFTPEAVSIKMYRSIDPSIDDIT